MTSSFDLVVRGLDDRTDPPPDCVVPFIDDRGLDDLVGEFEQAQGYEPAGGYNGLVPAFYGFGPVLLHYLGQSGLARSGSAAARPPGPSSQAG